MFTRTEDDFLALDRDVQTCDMAVAALSRITLSRDGYAAGEFTAEVLDMLRARTGSLLTFASTPGSLLACRRVGILTVSSTFRLLGGERVADRIHEAGARRSENRTSPAFP